MRLFCFASRNQENIDRGVSAKMWAVARVSDSSMQGRRTKARRYFDVGCVGLLYCKPSQSFAVPFVVESSADPVSVVTDVWPEPWVLPFSIRPLTSSANQIPAAIARARWPIIERRWPHVGGVTAAMNATGATVFAPIEIPDTEWTAILADFKRSESG